MTLPPEVWASVVRQLAKELPAFAVQAWLDPIVPSPDRDSSSLRLLCPSPFHRDRVRKHYLRAITRCLGEQLGSQPDVHLELSDGVDPLPGEEEPMVDAAVVPEAPERAAPAPAPAPTAAASHEERQPELPYSFDNFVVGRCNALAREASFAIAHRAQPALRQLYLCAGSGMGKTHLARAVAAETQRAGHERSVYVSAEAFTTTFQNAIRTGEMARFRRRFRYEPKLLVLDDLPFLAGKKQTQLELFRTVAHLLDAGGRVLLTGDAPPQALSHLEGALQSQLRASFVAEIEAPDARVRRHILRSKAAAGGIHLPDDCLGLLVENVSGSVRDIEGVLVQLVTTASLLKRPIDLSLTRQALERKLQERARLRRLDPGAVVRTVAAFFSTTPDALASRSRRRDILLPRQLAMYLCHRYTDASLAEIGRAFDRDHPAVRNAVRRIEVAIVEKVKLRYQVEALCEKLDELTTRDRA